MLSEECGEAYRILLIRSSPDRISPSAHRPSGRSGRGGGLLAREGATIPETHVPAPTRSASDPTAPSRRVGHPRRRVGETMFRLSIVFRPTCRRRKGQRKTPAPEIAPVPGKNPVPQRRHRTPTGGDSEKAPLPPPEHPQEQGSEERPGHARGTRGVATAARGRDAPGC